MEFVMKILFLEWKSYCVPDMAEAFTEAGHDVTLATCAEMTDRYNTEFDNFFEKILSESSYDAVFTFNYFPIVSKNCDKAQILYISWVYDNPLIALFSCTVINHVTVFSFSITILMNTFITREFPLFFIFLMCKSEAVM